MRPEAPRGRTSSSRLTAGRAAPRGAVGRGCEGGRAGRPPTPVPGVRAAPAPSRPAVTTPPLSAKNRPFSRRPEKHGVTPTARAGGRRGRPSSLSLLTQPLKPELPTAACGAQTGCCRGAARGPGKGVQVAEWSKVVLGGCVGASHREPGAEVTGWKAPHKESSGLGAPCLQALAGLRLGLGLDPIHHQPEPSLSPSHRHLGAGRGTSGWGRPGPCPCPVSASSPCATGRAVNAGGSGRGAGAQGLLSERQSVHGSGGGTGRGCWP